MTAPNQLGEFLRARRSRLRPTDVGLPAGVGLRRTPGLRREELAPDWEASAATAIAHLREAPGRWPTPERPPV